MSEALTSPARGSAIEPARLAGEAAVTPDESAAELESLRLALQADLAPRTPYELMLADNLVDLEWERRRARRWAVAVIFEEARRQLETRLGEGGARKTEAREICAAWASGSEEGLAAAEAAARRAGTSLAAVGAEAQSAQAGLVEPLLREIRGIEGRRRKLLADLRMLQARNRPAVAEDETTS
jgi:hypothetical protein